MKSDVREKGTGQTSQENASIPKRLVIELTKRASEDLGWLVELEESNKTTVVNRALQVYRMIIEAQQRGQQLIITNRDDSKAQALYIV